jgi:hypothetical protein
MEPAAVQQQVLLPDFMLEEIFARLPRKAFHRCRCLSRAWASTLSSDDSIDRNLAARGKMRLDYHDLMKSLVFGCCVPCGADKYNEIGIDVDGELSEEEEEEDIDTREEYRTRGYVEVDKDYRIQMAEMQAMLHERQLKFEEIFPDFSHHDRDIIPYGALHPRIRQPLLEEEAAGPSSNSLGGQGETEVCTNFMPIRGRQKTEEEVDQEIIAFLRGCLAMDPKPQVLMTETFLFSGKYIALYSLVRIDLLKCMNVDISNDHVFACIVCCSS